MNVYVVFDHDDMVIAGVFDSEVKAVQYVEDALKSMWQHVDVSEKEELKNNGWYQLFTYQQKDNPKDGEALYSIEECPVQ